MMPNAELTPRQSSQNLVQEQPPATPSPTFILVKRLAIVLWISCALVIPCFFPIVSLEPQRWWKLTGLILFGLSWAILFCGIFAAVMDNSNTSASPQERFAKSMALGVLGFFTNHRHDGT